MANGTTTHSKTIANIVCLAVCTDSIREFPCLCMSSEVDLLDNDATPLCFMKGPRIQIEVVVPLRPDALSKSRTIGKLLDPFCYRSIARDTANLVSYCADCAENDVSFSKHLFTNRQSRMRCKTEAYLSTHRHAEVERHSLTNEE